MKKGAILAEIPIVKIEARCSERLMTKYGFAEISQAALKSRSQAAWALRPFFLSRLFRDLILQHGQNDREQILVVTMNNQNVVNGLSIVATGSTSSVVTSVREVMKVAILQNAERICLAHNHPQGRAVGKGDSRRFVGFEPSQADIELTAALIFSCRGLGIEFMDHLILGGLSPEHTGSYRRQPYFSFMENGIIQSLRSQLGEMRVDEYFDDWEQGVPKKPLKLKISYAGAEKMDDLPREAA